MTRPTDESTNDDRPTMRDVNHTHQRIDRTAAVTMFARGPRIATDGGPEKKGDTMADVSHTPPNNAPDANRVFERGNERENELGD